MTFACGDYDRMRALKDGIVHVEGVRLTYLSLPPEEIFWRMLKYRSLTPRRCRSLAGTTVPIRGFGRLLQDVCPSA